MRTLSISVVAMALALVPAAAMAGRDSGPRPMPRPHVGGGHGGHVGGGMHGPRPGHVQWRNWGGRHNGRWHAGWRAPGGWTSYRRPNVGFVIPSYWMAPSYYIPNYSYYGFAQPSAGYGWSRYYNDAVMTDRYGRVYDYRSDVDWDRYDRYEDGDDYRDSYGYDEREGRGRGRGKDRDGGAGGAILGGAIGAIGGAAIAGRGDRTEGAIIGGVVGAVAGAAIDINDRDGRGHSRKIKKDKRVYHDGGRVYEEGDPRGARYRDDAVTYDGRWKGTWTGSYDGGPERVYEGEYEGEYRGSAPHWVGRGPQQRPLPAPGHHGGVTVVPGAGYGYGYGAPMTTTVILHSAPVVTTTTTTEYITEYVSVPRKRVVYRKPAKKVWKPKCVCR